MRTRVGQPSCSMVDAGQEVGYVVLDPVPGLSGENLGVVGRRERLVGLPERKPGVAEIELCDRGDAERPSIPCASQRVGNGAYSLGELTSFEQDSAEVEQ